ncbi:sensor histidine kinase [Hyalangium sp.]|uniref:sensor histidine kinase n=1 Tax=Hyalangium sp. TaxID=2028555 RepID=UPI002D63FD60|nr:ATP-binding protein [Hyalangium sp.]HYH94508.1 ATP-binding protein [Hyalangium sp.]
MTIRAKVLLLLAVALGLVGGMGAALYQGTSWWRLLSSWVHGSQEQRYLYSQLRGEALVFLGDLQRVHGSGAVSEAVLNGYRRQMDAQLSRLQELARAEEGWTEGDHEQELKHIERMALALRLWAVRAEDRVRKLPSGIGSDGAHPQVSIHEFNRDVEPLLTAALEMETVDLKALKGFSERWLRTGKLLAFAASVAALSVLLALALTILVPMNRRLQELVEAARRIGHGDFQPSLPEKGRDEFCILARAFNQMAQELRTSQSRLMHSDRLASLGRTVASVGHEINNPLVYVISNLAYAHGELTHSQGELSAKERRGLLEALDEAREGAERVRFIAQDLKTLARADDASTALVNVAEVVRDVARMASHELQGRARLVEDCAGVPPVRANATRLGQVFLNLIVNGAQAIAPGSPEQNEIRLTARLTAPGHITVDVKDTGCGIPPENLERIFDPFFTTKPVGEGTGLGLAVCLNIVRSLGGSITVDSAPGQGTTFHITLPVASVDTPPAPAV